MRLPDTEHESRPWRIHEIAPDFTLEDVWALPIAGSADEFGDLVELMTRGEESDGSSIGFLDSAAARFLWRLRDELGRVLRLGSIRAAADPAHQRPIPGDVRVSLSERLDEALRSTVAGVRFTAVPMVPLYRLEDEFAAELSNATMHGVMHLGWVLEQDGAYRGRMAVLVKPRGLFGRAYMAAIKPFRYAIVYPALLSYLERAWRESHPTAPPPVARGNRSLTRKRGRTWKR